MEAIRTNSPKIIIPNSIRATNKFSNVRQGFQRKRDNTNFLKI